jgi:hypothetical protein
MSRLTRTVVIVFRITQSCTRCLHFFALHSGTRTVRWVTDLAARYVTADRMVMVKVNDS